jgi:hypothetical protein
MLAERRRVNEEILAVRAGPGSAASTPSTCSTAP